MVPALNLMTWATTPMRRSKSDVPTPASVSQNGKSIHLLGIKNEVLLPLLGIKNVKYFFYWAPFSKNRYLYPVINKLNFVMYG
jgi:hypothetical protein